jgi:hypothetical protein
VYAGWGGGHSSAGGVGAIGSGSAPAWVIKTLDPYLATTRQQRRPADAPPGGVPRTRLVNVRTRACSVDLVREISGTVKQQEA